MGYNKKKNNGNNNKKSNPEVDAKRAEIIEKQKRNVAVLDAASEYLNEIISIDREPKDVPRVQLKDLKAYLMEKKGFAEDDILFVTDLLKLMIELTNCYSKPYITKDTDRIVLRIYYIMERFVTTFKKELNHDIEEMINKYPYLYGSAKEEPAAPTELPAQEVELGSVHLDEVPELKTEE